MDPNQLPSPASQAPQQNPYDFITNQVQPPKKPALGGDSTKTRIIIVAAGVFVLIIIASIIGTILSSAGSGDIKALKTVVAQQQEIVRLTGLGEVKAQDTTIRSLALTTKLSVASQQQQLTQYLGTRNIKLNKIELAARENTLVDKELDTAGQSNHYDDVFKEKITAALQAYMADLQAANSATSSQKAKTIVADSYRSAGLMLGLKEE